MPGRQTYVLYSLAREGYLREDERTITRELGEAGRFNEGTALDLVVEHANIATHSKGLVLMLSPECDTR